MMTLDPEIQSLVSHLGPGNNHISSSPRTASDRDTPYPPMIPSRVASQKPGTHTSGIFMRAADRHLSLPCVATHDRRPILPHAPTPPTDGNRAGLMPTLKR